ncbi:hypothetical protein [Desulfosporosinus lacus]|uniref:Uracil DNA glycosylase superfamily protein n=1 Tax=Desulfosporosinus lacus DSM 15449 TaxID=1121420 RepID=A0A1M6AQS4_9FIRM|nr:hypothetical protein SAMN02746098_04015 [Desulfosporosinus lacus DSM 15449]
MQDKVYREIHSRIDTSNIYIRSAVSDCGIVPSSLNWWGNEVASEIKLLRKIILEYNPKLLISFGGFPYEFLRRVFEIKPKKGPKYWSPSILKNEFDRSINNFDVDHTNIIPLLRRIIPNDGTEQYFQYAGTNISERIIQNKDSLEIWIK